MNVRRAGLACLALLLAVGTVAAQEVTRGSMIVRVEDPTGAVIPGANVTIVANVQPELTKETRPDGEILFANLIPGTYTVTVAVSGFKTARVENVDLRLGERRLVSVTLEPGQLVQTVEVIGAAGGVDLSTTTTGGHIQDTIYETVPIQRGITNAFFLAPGVSDSGGTCGNGQEDDIGIQAMGCANPSIGGASGFENLYMIDGVNVTHGGFGGFGTVSRVFGALGSGTTTSFIKEVEVKTGGYEAQYGQATGGIINVVTKTGGNEYHGAVFGYYTPNKLTAAFKQPNDFRTTNFQPFDTRGVMNVDFGFELGGPIVADKLFFFGSLNPTVTRFQRTAPQAPQAFDQFAYGPGDCNPATNPDPTGDPFSSQALAGCFNLGSIDARERTINYAFKLTGQITQDHRVEASVFGDPTIRKFGPHRSLLTVPDRNDFTSRPDFSRLDLSNLNLALRYNGILSPTWLVNSHFSNNHNRFEEQELLNQYAVTDQTGPITTFFGGAGFFENSISDDKAFSVDNTNIFNFLGQHELTEGFYFSTNHFTGLRRRTGPDFPVVSDPLLVRPQDVGQLTTGGTFQLFSCQRVTSTPDCFGQAPAGFQGATDTFFARQSRGQFFGSDFNTVSRYTAGFAQDNWQMNQHLTLKLGLRWEQEELKGNTGVSYTYTGSWGPRVGVILDPLGDRRTKVSFNFARFFQKLPNDLTMRVLSGGQSYLNLQYWVEPDKAIRPDQAHFQGTQNCPGGGLAFLCDPNTGGPITGSATPSLSGTTGIAPIPGTKQTFQDEFGFGIQHEFDHGVVVGGRFIDRRIKRITEDGNGVSIEQAAAGLFNIPFILMNPSASADLFTNPTIIPVGSGACFSGTANFDGNNNCFSAASGNAVPDGIVDGLPNAIRDYRAVELTLERRMRDNWQFFANYRIARLEGNFEGAFRNDNNQTDPGITSLFDFIDSPAALSLYRVGPLPNDRRHVVNAYGSYMFNEGAASGLNVGFGLRVSSGKPLSELLAHPLFSNSGEIACAANNLNVLDSAGNPVFVTGCSSDGRGALGRSLTFGTVDMRADYPVRIGERYTVRGSVDFFNVFNARRNQATREFKESSFGLLDPDFNTPTRFQQPFSVRFAVRFEF